MKVLGAISNIKKIVIPQNSKEVVRTVAEEIKTIVNNAEIVISNDGKNPELDSVFYIGFGSDYIFEKQYFDKESSKHKNGFFQFSLDDSGSGKLIASREGLLYSAFRYVMEFLSAKDTSVYRTGRDFEASFLNQKVLWDHFLTQGGRTQRNMNKEEYVKGLARLGFNQIEVNALASPMAMEWGPVGEVYPMFYTYMAALDQFVYSELNKGIYPYYYLKANLTLLKKNAELAKKYGLTPGLFCCEPRNVPEKLFRRYPMLRGGRIDHPFRSFEPRYTLTTAHPKVREHYTEMMQKLMKEVPELGYMTVWTNDSGSGYEYTKSLYVGRNGGPYLIREWKSDEEIAKVAGANILQFLKTIRDAASKINPDFRVITRLESFYGEHDTVWAGLGDRIDVEANTLLARGWVEIPYRHPRYDDIKEIAGTPYQYYLDEKEKPFIDEMDSKGGAVHVNISHGGCLQMFEPLIGIPYPWMAYSKIKSMKDLGVKYLSHLGGINPPDLAPYSINHEIFKEFQFNSKMNIDESINEIAKRWAGEECYKELVEGWKYAEEAIKGFPIMTSLYCIYGFTWYRLWTRPYVPNIEAIPEKERAYYEEFMCTTPHNPNNVDLAKDVLFELTTQQKAELTITRMDENVWTNIDKAIDILDKAHKANPDKIVFYDQRERLKALKYWFKTMRNVAAWIAGVHGWLDSKNETDKKKYRTRITEMMNSEIANTKELIELWETTKIEFMAISDVGETPLIYGEDLSIQLKTKIDLMKKHMNDEPYIDPDYMMKRSELIWA
jgi:hypothetical protein